MSLDEDSWTPVNETWQEDRKRTQEQALRFQPG